MHSAGARGGARDLRPLALGEAAMLMVTGFRSARGASYQGAHSAAVGAAMAPGRYFETLVNPFAASTFAHLHADPFLSGSRKRCRPH